MVMETIDRMGGMLRLCGAVMARMPIPPFRARLVFNQLDQVDLEVSSSSRLRDFSPGWCLH